MNPPKADSAGRRGPLFFIILTVLLDTMGFGLIIPVLPNLIAGLGHVSMDQASVIGGTLIMTYALVQFLFAPVIGGLSDAYGRRPVLLASMAGFAGSMLIAASATVLATLFIGRILAGITGASYSTANAYIADITTQEKRASTYGLLGVAFGMGFILGPAAGGLLGAIDPRFPFLAAAVLAACNMVMGFFLLPESLPVERRRRFDWRRANPIGTLRQIARLGGPLKKLATVYFLWMLALQSLHGIWNYVAAYRYHWSPLGIGLSLTFVGVLAVFVNGFLVRRSVEKLGEWRTGLWGIGCGTIAYVIQIFAFRPEFAYVALAVGAMGGLTIPALQAMMTSRAAPGAQGELQGALATLASLSIIAGPLIFSNIFAMFTGADARIHAPGAPFIMSTLLGAAAFLVFATNPPEGKKAVS